MEKLSASWRALAANVDHFFNQHSAGLTCHKGCSKCCETDRSVFGLEAAIIEDHVRQLNPHEREQLKVALAQESHPNHCAFLRNGLCQIYEVRPILCRSHGLVHLNETGPHHCELNYEAGLPPKEDWLNEERLNTLLALLQKEYEKTGARPVRVSLHTIAKQIQGSSS